MWKCHKETPCVAILNKQKYHLFFPFFCKIGEQEGGTGPDYGGGQYQWEGEGGEERV
jgi:hypothetical protein